MKEVIRGSNNKREIMGIGYYDIQEERERTGETDKPTNNKTGSWKMKGKTPRKYNKGKYERNL